ncbi:MAG: iron-sulfur cluster carrier protein ApbC [Gammaproteobacteria bacterium]
MSITQQQVEHALKNFVDPYLNCDWLTAKAVSRIEVTANTVAFDVVLGYPAKGCQQALLAACKAKLADQLSLAADQITLNLTWQIQPHAVAPGLKSMANIKNIIAIASGKGGVGKSTTAVNLALALQLDGAQVGILDADIYGPNQPHMLGVTERPTLKDEKGLIPVVRYGVQSMSIGYLIAIETPMVWRGPMATRALQQLLFDTQWQNLDYLIVDLPPGTGDIQLTLSQKIPLSGAVIITTPQEIALLDARKGLEMFRKVRVPVLGVVENMSDYICSHCEHREAIFGTGGAERLAKECNTELLGQLPLAMRIRIDADNGCPTVIAAPESELAQRYRHIARCMAGRLARQSRDFMHKFPTIVVEHN